jgi:hypothetical protein
LIRFSADKWNNKHAKAYIQFNQTSFPSSGQVLYFKLKYQNGFPLAGDSIHDDAQKWKYYAASLWELSPKEKQVLFSFIVLPDQFRLTNDLCVQILICSKILGAARHHCSIFILTEIYFGFVCLNPSAGEFICFIHV